MLQESSKRGCIYVHSGSCGNKSNLASFAETQLLVLSYIRTTKRSGGGGGKGLVDCFSVGVITQSSKRWSNIDLHRPSMCPKQFSCLY